MVQWWRDVRFGLRMLARNKGFSTIAILALALGIGPNVAIFSIIWATFLAPLPYPHGDRLVVVWNQYKGERNGTRADDYAEYAAQSRSFERLDLNAWTTLHLTSRDHVDQDVYGRAMTPGFLTKNLGLAMALGRDFLPDEGTPGNDHLVVVTHRLWESYLHADPTIVGQQIRIEDQPYTVIGVLQPSAADRNEASQFIVPLVVRPGQHNAEYGTAIGRLKPGITLAQAQAELSVIDHRLALRRRGGVDPKAWSISVEQLKNDWLDRKLQRNLWLLLAAVALVLLIACANVANLLLARGAARQQELALRSALGATRRQVFAQLLTESLTLSLLGGAIGIAAGVAIMKLSMAILPLAKMTAEAVVELNLPVLCFAVAVTLIGGVLFGCAPAWQATRVNLSETLKQGSRSISGRSRRRTQGILVTAEFALALTLLAGAGMALHSFWNLSRIDLGISTSHILIADLQRRSNTSGQAHAFSPPEQLAAGQRLLLDRLRSVPGVESAALATNMPLEGYGAFPFAIQGQPMDQTHPPVADLQAVSPGFFSTFGIHLARGRFFNDFDTVTSPLTIMVNESFVRHYLANADPLMQRVVLAFPDPVRKGPGRPITYQIVGVYHDVLNSDHLTGKARPAMYLSMLQAPGLYVELAVHTAVDPAAVTSAIRAAVAAAAPDLSVNHVRSMQQIVDDQLTFDRFGMVLFGCFAGIALLLAALGIYGVMSFVVAQRAHEVGLRMALGAQKSQVVTLMVWAGIKLALPGLAIGLAGVYVLGRLMRSTLYGVGSVDYFSSAAVAALLLAVAVFACWVPARRSAQVDPMVALRQE